jgi:peptide/nickel transport system substrate-binding protein
MNKIKSFFNALFINLHHPMLTQKIETLVKRMKYSEKIFFGLVCFVMVISGIVLLLQINNLFLVEVPVFGGSFTEGVIGSPRFVNPVIAISDTDKDLSSLIYSGLLKINEKGELEPDMAESYNISADGTVYDFIIKNYAYFHDGKKVTADDVVFTIQKILDPVIKSPKVVNWAGVAVEKVSDNEVRFTLKKPYSPFLQSLTLGILPKHIWEKVSAEEFPFSEFNVNPIGSGPYKIEKIVRNSGGIPSSITLGAWKRYALGSPKIKNIVFKFFSNETELARGYSDKSVESASGLNYSMIKNIIINKNLIKEESLPRVFGVFLNQNSAPIFLNKEIRQAMDLATPKKQIVDEVLLGSGKVLNGPTPANIENEVGKATGDIESAKSILAKAGWKTNADGILEKIGKDKKTKTTFSFSISTSDAPELKQTAEILADAWRKLGASVTIKVFEAGDLSQNVIKPRKYDALLFGEVVGSESDLYPFWHSSERNDPGLNISLYANITVDKALETAEQTTDQQTETAQKEIVFSEIAKDIPAIFLFAPDSIYLESSQVKNIAMKNVSSLNERFIGVKDWFIETDKVWKIFVKN